MHRVRWRCHRVRHKHIQSGPGDAAGVILAFGRSSARQIPTLFSLFEASGGPWMSPLKDPTRREFLVAGSAAALAAASPAAAAPADAKTAVATHAASGEALAFSAGNLLEPAPQRTFSGERATQVAMPIGGIGAGCICLNGYGGLQDFPSVRGLKPPGCPPVSAPILPRPLLPFSISRERPALPGWLKGRFPPQNLRPGARDRACGAAD